MEVHSEEWQKGYLAGRTDGYDLGYYDKDDAERVEETQEGRAHSLQNLDARLYSVEVAMAQLIRYLGVG